MRLILLNIYILLISFHVSAQNFIEVKANEILFRIAKNDPKKNEVVRKSDNSFLKLGFYKAISDNRFILFQVSDSGRLNGSLKTYDKQVLFNETLWQDGIKTREYVYLNERIAMESFDSTVTVLLYDSIRNEWRAQKKKLTVEKEFHKENKEMRIRFARGGYNSYAIYYYEFGKLIKEIIPNYFEKKYDSSGNITLLVEYNWKLKQIETSNFKRGKVISRNILKNKYIIWDSKGMLQYPDKEIRGNENTNIDYYSSGSVMRKEIIKNGTRIVIDYDLKGKIKNQATYKTSEQEDESNAVPPVEIKQ